MSPPLRYEVVEDLGYITRQALVEASNILDMTQTAAPAPTGRYQMVSGSVLVPGDYVRQDSAMLWRRIVELVSVSNRHAKATCVDEWGGRYHLLIYTDQQYTAWIANNVTVDHSKAARIMREI